MMRAIESSMFSHIGYDKPGMFLTVRYHPSKKQREAGEPGDLWQYRHYTAGLPTEQPEEGWGRWFLANVKGKYEGERVVPEDPFQNEHLDALDNLQAEEEENW